MQAKALKTFDHYCLQTFFLVLEDFNGAVRFFLNNLSFCCEFWPLVVEVIRVVEEILESLW